MGFFLLLFLWAAFTAIGELLRPKPKFGTPTPSSLGEFQVPTAQEGRSVPVVFGTVKIAGPNVVWYGGLDVQAQKQKVKTGLFSSKKITTGYKYFMTQQLALCHGVLDELLEVRFDDRAVPFTIAPGIFRPIEPSQGGWGPGGAPTPAQCVDEMNSDGDLTFMQGPSGNPGIQTGYRVTFATPTSAELNGWKLHVVDRKVLSGNLINDDMLIYSASAWTGTTYPNATWNSGNLVKQTASPWISNVLTALYQQFTIEFTPAEAAQMKNQGGISILHRSATSGGTGGAVQRETQVWLEVPGSLANEPATLKIDATAQFGGDEREGGVQGYIDLYRGSLTQTANPALQSAVGATLPAYRGIAYAVLRGGPFEMSFNIAGLSAKYVANIPGFYLGTSPYLKNIAFVVRRCPNTLGVTGGAENIGGDANPACMLYEILTNDRWGLGIPAAQIDVPSFTAAANTLFGESFGLAMIVDSGSPAADLLADILRHIDGVIYTDPSSGLIKLKLARADYNVADLMRLDESFGIKSCKLSRSSWDDTKNVVKIHYVDRTSNYLERIAQAQDLANVQARSGEVSEEEFPFRGITNAALAQKVAARVLKTVTYPLAAVELQVTRAAWALRPGDVFRLSWAPLGISDMAVRVLRIATGEVRDGTIRIDAVEDIFAVAWTGYSPPATGGWIDPVTAVGALTEPKMIETPYAMVIGPDRLALALAASDSPSIKGFQVWSDPDGGSDYVFSSDVTAVTPTGTLVGSVASGDIGYTTTTINITPGPGMVGLLVPTASEFSAGQAVMLIDAEMIAWQNYSIEADGSYTFVGCVRGVMDTTPVRHAGGSRVWFVSDGGGLTSQTPYAADFTLNAKLLPYNTLAIESLANVSEISVTLNSRALRPYVPTAITVNTVAYPVLISGALVVAWSHRNRLGAWVFDDAGVAASPEAGTTYTLRLYDNNDVLRRTYSGLTGTTQTWTTEDADSGLGGGVLNSRVRLELEAVVGGLVSFQVANIEVWRTIETPGTGPTSAAWRDALRARRRAGRTLRARGDGDGS